MLGFGCEAARRYIETARGIGGDHGVMQASKGKGLGRRLVGRCGAGGNIFAAVFGRHNVADAANDSVAKALEHQRDFGAEVRRWSWI
jgi:hypothetical protein